MKYLAADHLQARLTRDLAGARAPDFERTIALYGPWGGLALISVMLLILRPRARKSH